jgi:pimeloyl-ACP methyl ester carboxylesterase
MVKMNQRFEHIETEIPKSNNNGAPPLPKVLKLIQFGFGTLGRVFPEKASDLALKLFGTPRMRARHKVSDEIIESAENFHFDSRGLRLKGYEWGSGEKTILLVHGWESRGTALRTFIPAFIDQGYRVITFDAPAHGDSPGKWTNIVQYAKAISDLIAKKGQVYGIITHSLGGAATMFAFHKINPELVTEKLVLIASPRNISDSINEAIELLNLPKNAANKFISKVENILDATIEETSLSSSAGIVSINKILVIHDVDDKIVPFIAAETNFEAFDNARLITTKGLGHYLLMKDKQIIQKITQFIIH